MASLTQMCADIIAEKDAQIANLEEKIKGLQQEQIAEMKEHEDAMKLADKTIKGLEEQISNLINVVGNYYREQIVILEKAIDVAVEDLDNAKDMLRECGKNEWASLFDTSADCFKARAKNILSVKIPTDLQ